MNILYGIQTTGNGHISRSRLMIAALKAAGHSVTTLFSGYGRSSFWDYAEFMPFDESRGLTFVTENGQINYFKTTLHAKPVELATDIKQLDLSGFDAVISDFEPITAWAARRQNVVSIGISHQEAFHYDIPKRNGNRLARLIMQYYAPTQHRIGLHWHHFNQPILPPIIETGLTALPIVHNMILVYLPFEARASVIPLLRTFKDHTFHFYTDVKQVEQFGNVILHPFNRLNFVNDLRRCAGVICQAGFELPSEALHLGKKLLVKPVQRQYEQMSNATALSQCGFGRSMEKIDCQAIAAFLDAPSSTAKSYPDVAQAIASWIGSADLDAPNAHQSLVDSLWLPQPHPYKSAA